MSTLTRSTAQDNLSVNSSSKANLEPGLLSSALELTPPSSPALEVAPLSVQLSDITSDLKNPLSFASKQQANYLAELRYLHDLIENKCALEAVIAYQKKKWAEHQDAKIAHKKHKKEEAYLFALEEKAKEKAAVDRPATPAEAAIAIANHAEENDELNLGDMVITNKQLRDYQEDAKKLNQRLDILQQEKQAIHKELITLHETGKLNLQGSLQQNIDTVTAVIKQAEQSNQKLLQTAQQSDDPIIRATIADQARTIDADMAKTLILSTIGHRAEISKMGKDVRKAAKAEKNSGVNTVNIGAMLLAAIKEARQAQAGRYYDHDGFVSCIERLRENADRMKACEDTLRQVESTINSANRQIQRKKFPALHNQFFSSGIHSIHTSKQRNTFFAGPQQSSAEDQLIKDRGYANLNNKAR